MKKLFLLLFFSILLVGFASAGVIPITNYTTEFTGSAYSGLGGLRLTFNTTQTINAVQIASTINGQANNLSDAWVCTGMSGNACNGTIIAHAVIKTPFANFSTPWNANAGGSGYLFLFNTSNGSIQRGQNSTTSTPFSFLYGTANSTINPDTQVEQTTWAVDLVNIYNGTTAGAPTVLLNSPANTYNSTVGTILFDATVLDSAMVKNVTLFIDGQLNQTNSSGLNGTYQFTKTLAKGSHYWQISAYNTADQLTNSSNRTFTIDYIFPTSLTYDTSILEGSATTFYANFTTNSSSAITSGRLYYNGTQYNGTLVSLGGGNYSLTRSITAPTVAANNVFGWYWNVSLANNYYQNTTNLSQTVVNFGLDNCSTNTIQILNLTLVDEDTQVWITNQTLYNTSIKLDLYLYSDPGMSNLVLQYSHFYNQTNPARVCVNSALGSSVFYENAQIEYTANNYADEFYNIQNYSLNASANPSENMTLYDLISSHNQVFVISYKDASFLPVQDALIQISRKYIDEGVFKTVEAPITDSNGETVGNLVLNNVIYDFTVVKNGQVLAVFNNYLAKCQNPLIQTCRIDLNAPASTISVTNFTSVGDFLYTLTYNNNTRTISSTFTIPSNAVALVTLNVTTEDALSTVVCSQSLTSSTGTLDCVIPNTTGNGTVMANLYKNGELVAYGQINLSQRPGQIFGGALVLLLIFAVLMLIGASVSDSPAYTILFLMFGVLMLLGINLVGHNGFIGGAATILFLIIAIILVVIKIGKRT